MSIKRVKHTRKIWDFPITEKLVADCKDCRNKGCDTLITHLNWCHIGKKPPFHDKKI